MTEHLRAFGASLLCWSTQRVSQRDSFSGLELLGAGCDGFFFFPCAQHLAGLPSPPERGTSGFQVVLAGLEYRAGKHINKSELASAVRCYFGGVLCGLFWFHWVFFFNGIIKNS